jgi:hypothetical protein
MPKPRQNTKVKTITNTTFMDDNIKQNQVLYSTFQKGEERENGIITAPIQSNVESLILQSRGK